MTIIFIFSRGSQGSIVSEAQLPKVLPRLEGQLVAKHSQQLGKHAQQLIASVATCLECHLAQNGRLAAWPHVQIHRNTTKLATDGETSSLPYYPTLIYTQSFMNLL